MARPAKVGLDYYPMDVGFLRDKKVRLLFTEFGASSVIFVLYVLGRVYEDTGYYLRWDRDEALMAANDIHVTPQYISEVLQGCLSRSIFDDGVFQVFGILTSAGIQRRYLRGCEKRGEIEMIREYWLLDEDDKKDVPASVRAKLTFFQVSGGKNEVNSPGNPVNSPGNPQSKGKESNLYTEIISYLNEKAGTGYRSTSRKTRSLIDARIREGFGFSDFQRVIDNKVADWNHPPRGGREDMRPYLRPETLFGTKFESYLNQRGAEEGEERRWRRLD